MIHANRHAPTLSIRERGSYQDGPPCACGGRIAAVIVPLWRQRYPGEVQYRCTGCARVETAQERVATRQAQDEIIARLETRTCAREGCDKPVRSLSNTYCGRTCANTIRAQDAKSARAAQKSELGIEVTCGCGCGRTFVIEHRRGPKRRWYDVSCRVRASREKNDAYHDLKQSRRDRALEMLREFHARTGRSPTRDELGLKGAARRDYALPCGATLKLYFRSTAEAFALAGIPTRQAGQSIETEGGA